MQGISCQHANLIQHLETDNVGRAHGSWNIIHLKGKKEPTRRLLQLWNKTLRFRRALQPSFSAAHVTSDGSSCVIIILLVSPCRVFFCFFFLQGCTARPLRRCAFHYSTFYLSSGEWGGYICKCDVDRWRCDVHRFFLTVLRCSSLQALVIMFFFRATIEPVMNRPSWWGWRCCNLI